MSGLGPESRGRFLRVGGLVRSEIFRDLVPESPEDVPFEGHFEYAVWRELVIDAGKQATTKLGGSFLTYRHAT